jgi:hypothetical protein
LLPLAVCAACVVAVVLGLPQPDANVEGRLVLASASPFAVHTVGHGALLREAHLHHSSLRDDSSDDDGDDDDAPVRVSHARTFALTPGSLRLPSAPRTARGAARPLEAHLPLRVFVSTHDARGPPRA